MKYKHLLFLFFITTSGVFNLSRAQSKSRDFWQMTTKDSITELVKNFGKAADLNFDPEALSIGLAESRENTAGIELFKRLFVLPEDSGYNSQYNIGRIINFLDPDYILLVHEMDSCGLKNQKCRDSIRNVLRNTKYLSVNEYYEVMKKNYDRDNSDINALPGTMSEIDASSIVVSNERQKSSGKRYVVNASAAINFSGFYTKKDGTASNISLENFKLIFEISFDAIKASGSIVYANFKIDRVSEYIPDKPPVIKKYKITIQPLLGGGFRSINGAFSNNSLEKTYKDEGSNCFDFGIMVEKKLGSFRNENFDFRIASGIIFSQFSISTSLSDVYAESLGMNINDAPFAASSFLKEYSIESKFEGVQFTDNLWYLGIPLRLGIGFKIARDNRLRGYLQSGITYFLPMSSSTKTKGLLDQSGRFLYEHVPGDETIVLIGGDNNPFPDYYGKKDALSGSKTEFVGGFESKSELGISIKLRGNNYLNIGPYFSIGSFKPKSSPPDHLATQDGKVYSPIMAMNKFSFLGYGVSMSVSFDLIKLEVDKTFQK